MRRTILGAALAALAVGGPHAAGAADPPYRASTRVTGLAWDRASFRSGELDADIWPVTTGADGKLYAAYGDGSVGCPTKVSYGIALATGGPTTNLVGVGCGPEGQGHGKIISLLDKAGTLYGVVDLEDQPWPGPSFQIWSSPDHGRTWRKPGWRFSGADGAIRPMNLVNFGPGDAGASDAYVYMTAQKALPDAEQRSAYLMRARSDALLDQGAYAYFAGTDGQGQPAWSADPGAAVPVFADRNGVTGPEIVWAPPLGRFLMTAAHTKADQIGVFEAPAMWGPWATVDYEEGWLGMTGGQFLGLRFPILWMGADGTSLWAVFSCYGSGSGPYHDRLNLMKATLRTR